MTRSARPDDAVGTGADVGICRLENPIRHYAWGSHSAIAQLQRRDVPSEQPEAELWMGAHPAAPSRVTRSGASIGLDAWLEETGGAVLGAELLDRVGPRLPFLLKLLAAEQPLSIQAHPNAEQARAGFEREDRDGIPVDAEHRNYRDPYPKPELICALSEFWGLCGFRPVAEIADGFRAAGVATFSAEVDALEASGDLSRFFESVMQAEPARAKRAVADAAAGSGPADAECRRWLRTIVERHPDDVGALAPLLLNVVRLAPGEAIFLEAGVLHSYLHGTGVEIMASSDNVLRGGLTPKHVDVPELLATLHFESRVPQILRPIERAGGERVFETPADEFELAQIRLEDGDRWSSQSHPGPAIWFVSEGRLQVRDPSSNSAMAVDRGESVLVPHCVEGIEWTGTGTAFRASPASR
jgi:mannose-6-phosphate isomerase